METGKLGSDRIFNVLFENTKDAVFITTADGRIVLANPAALELTKMSSDELNGTTIHALFDSVHREASMRQLAWLGEKSSVGFPAKLIDGDGGVHDVEVSSKLGLNGDEVIVLISDKTAINRLISKAAQSEKLESLGVLAGGMAQDFENFLEAIVGSVEMAKECWGNPDEVKAYLDIILRSAQRAEDLTRRLMIYAKKSKIRFEQVNLNDIIYGAVGFAEDNLPFNISIRTDLDDTIGAIKGDIERLETAITNLLLNAREAMPDGGEILISTRNFSADERFVRDFSGTSPGANVELIVRDSGRGISPEIIPHIFDPFYTSKDRRDGAGLGLAITHAIITSHGGHIDIDTKPNQGTTVRVLLPIIDAREEPDIGVIAASGKTVLIVDDEKIIQKVLASILSQLGYSPIAVSSGVEAVEFIAEGETQIDAVFLDMVMPGLTGHQTFNRIHSLWPEIPIVIITGYADERQALEIAESGLAGAIDKPFKAGQIARVMTEIFPG